MNYFLTQYILIVGCVVISLSLIQLVKVLKDDFFGKNKVSRSRKIHLPPLRTIEKLPSGRLVKYPEIHPILPDMLDGMRNVGEQDHYKGASWDTIMNLCDEVELLQMRNTQLEALLKEES